MMYKLMLKANKIIRFWKFY